MFAVESEYLNHCQWLSWESLSLLVTVTHLPSQCLLSWCAECMKGVLVLLMCLLIFDESFSTDRWQCYEHRPGGKAHPDWEHMQVVKGNEKRHCWPSLTPSWNKAAVVTYCINKELFEMELKYEDWANAHRLDRPFFVSPSLYLEFSFLLVLIVPHMLCSPPHSFLHQYVCTQTPSHTFLHDGGSCPRYFNYYINLTVSAGCACCDCCERPANKWLLYPPTHPLYLPLHQMTVNTRRQTVVASLRSAFYGPLIITVHFNHQVNL